MEPDTAFTRRVCAVLLADVSGFSKHMGEDDERTARAVHHLQAIAQGVVNEHNGRAEPVGGDALFATFDSVVTAVQAAVALQHRIAAEPARARSEGSRYGSASTGVRRVASRSASAGNESTERARASARAASIRFTS